MKKTIVTMGVEEEFLLLDPVSGLPVAASRQVQEEPGPPPCAGGVDHELSQAQIETNTPVCTTTDQLATHLDALRTHLHQAAHARGYLLAHTGAAPDPPPHPVPLTTGDRYRTMHEADRRLADEQLICGMHLHLGIPDRRDRITALRRLRPWLPLLLALSGSSPLWNGHDTGYASWRTVVFGRWPISGPPPLLTTPEKHDQRLAQLTRQGLLPDRRQVYWHARLSDRYPTFEIRVFDVQAIVDDAVTLAALTRALVQWLLTKDSLPDPRPELLQAATWQAARYGLTGTLWDPHRDTLTPSTDTLHTSLHRLGPNSAHPRRRSGGDQGHQPPAHPRHRCPTATHSTHPQLPSTPPPLRPGRDKVRRLPRLTNHHRDRPATRPRPEPAVR
ncbi:YbdK family carboxylate-amine ligase [Streptomyces sp. NPDC057798]|uniref:carboxylate-amine ligase n=1 Tax=Streptomyces sp. NPDC057798 TaxID=3346252 RepID=UPI00368C0063